MGKARRKVHNTPKKASSLEDKQTFASKRAVSIFSKEADKTFGVAEPKSKPLIAKKLKRKLKHDTFVKKITTKPKKVKPSSSLNMSSIRAELKEVASNAQPTSQVKSSAFFNPKTLTKQKQRNANRAREMQRFNAVLNFKVFQENPVKVVQEHLANTFNSNIEQEGEEEPEI